MEFKNFEISIKQNIGYDDAIGLKFKIDRGKVSKLWKTFVRVFQIVTKPVVPKKTKKAQAHQMTISIINGKVYLFIRLLRATLKQVI